MERSIQLYGHIDKEGKSFISGIEKLDEFFRHWKKKQFIIEVIAMEKGTTDHHVWYIIKMIIPAFRKGSEENGLLISPEESLQMIIDCCPIFIKNDGKETYNLFDWNKYEPDCEMSAEELEIAIEWLHIYCLENFDIAIGNFKSL